MFSAPAMPKQAATPSPDAGWTRIVEPLGVVMVGGCESQSQDGAQEHRVMMDSFVMRPFGSLVDGSNGFGAGLEPGGGGLPPG